MRNLLLASRSTDPRTDFALAMTCTFQDRSRVQEVNGN